MKILKKLVLNLLIFSLWYSGNFYATETHDNLDINNVSEKKTEKKKKTVRDLTLERIIYPLLIKWEEIKEVGLEKKDITKIVGFGGLSYCAKKANDYMGLSSIVKKDLLSAFSDIKNYCLKNKRKTIVVLGCITSPFILIKLYKKFKADHNHPKNCIGQFLLSLSEEQRLAINQSSELYHVVAQSGDNPRVLLENSDFMSILEDSQKIQLKQIVEHYSHS